MHVHNRAKRSISVFRPTTGTSVYGWLVEIESTAVLSASIGDVIYFKRRCQVEYSIDSMFVRKNGPTKTVQYHVPLFGGDDTIPRTAKDLVDIKAN